MIIVRKISRIILFDLSKEIIPKVLFNINEIILSIENTTKDEVKELHDNSQPSSSKDETSINDTQPTTESDPSEANTIKSTSSAPIDVKPNDTTDKDNDDISSPFTSPIKLEQIIDNQQSSIEKILQPKSLLNIFMILNLRISMLNRLDNLSLLTKLTHKFIFSSKGCSIRLYNL